MKKEKGITLIALVITIVVMIILVGVTVTRIINSDLINKAKETGAQTKEASEAEPGQADDLMNGFLADLSGLNGTLTINANEIETESRAVILELTAGETPTESEILALAETEKKNMLVESLSIYWNWPEATWEDLEFEGTAEELYSELVSENEIDSSEFTSFSDFLIKTGVCYPNTTFTCNGQTTTSRKAEFVIAKNGTYTVTAANTEGIGTTNVNVTHCKVEEFSNIQSENTTLTIDGFTVTVPAGFAYGTSTNVGHVTTGLVITDSIEVVNGKNYSNGNEFVWIPVNENFKVGTASNNKLMARISSGSNYQGVLYSYSGIGNSVISTELTNYGVNTSSWREPVFLTDSNSGDASSHNTIGITQTSLQSEYNIIIYNVRDYKGFYIGRYEMGIENGNAVSKLGVTPASAQDGCIDIVTGEGSLMWWGLYDKAKTYTNSSNSVQSHMMLGASYDAILNYAIEGADKGKITSTSYGNYSGTLLKTGTTKSSDKINNIFDLGGNMREWTMEGKMYVGRVCRGRQLLERESSML